MTPLDKCYLYDMLFTRFCGTLVVNRVQFVYLWIYSVCNKQSVVTFEVLMAVSLRIHVFWNISLGCWGCGSHCFKGTLILWDVRNCSPDILLHPRRLSWRYSCKGANIKTCYNVMYWILCSKSLLVIHREYRCCCTVWKGSRPLNTIHYYLRIEPLVLQY